MGKRKDIRPMPEAKILRATFDYNPETGELRWKTVNPLYRKARSGDLAGSVCSRGYHKVRVSGRYYLAHRVIWKIVTGDEPEDQIDHIDGDRLNNRWANFRPVSNGQNIQNAKLRADNKSGVKGVCWDAGHKAWLASITANGRLIKIGRFQNIEDAAQARKRAETILHGEYARAA